MPHQCTGCGHTFEDGSKEMLSGCPDCGGNKFQFRPTGASSDSTPGGGETPTPSDDTADDPAEPPTEGTDQSPDSPDRSGTDGSSVAETVGRATTRVRDFVASDPAADAEWPDDWESGTDTDDPGAPSDPSPSPSETPSASGADASHDSEDDIIDADARRAAAERDSGSKENAAQASARADVVSSDELDGNAEAEKPPAPDRSSRDASDVSSDGEIVSEPAEAEPDLTELREQLNDQFESIKILEPGQYELNLMELYDREEYIIALQENGRYVIQVPEQWIGEDLEDR